MSIRRNPIYLSNEVWRSLSLLARAKPGRNIVTPDEVADQLLRETIEIHFPKLTSHQKTLDKIEKEIIESLRDENTN